MGGGSSKNPQEEEAKREKARIQKFVSHILVDEWKCDKNLEHVTKSTISSEIYLLDKSIAYCLPCRKFIYCEISYEDSDILGNHVYQNNHSCKLIQLAENSWKCNKSSDLLTIRPFKRGLLDQRIHEHVVESQHFDNMFLWTDPEYSFLSALSTTEVSNEMFLSPCRLCSRADSSPNHSRSFSHLTMLKRYLGRITGEVELSRLKDEENLLTLYGKLAEYAELAKDDSFDMEKFLAVKSIETDFSLKKDAQTMTHDKLAFYNGKYLHPSYENVKVLVDALNGTDQKMVVNASTETENFTEGNILNAIKVERENPKKTEKKSNPAQASASNVSNCDKSKTDGKYQDDLRNLRRLMLGVQSLPKEHQLEFIADILRKMLEVHSDATLLEFDRNMLTVVPEIFENFVGFDVFGDMDVKKKLEFVLGLLNSMMAQIQGLTEETFLTSIRDETWKSDHVPHPSTMCREFTTRDVESFWETLEISLEFRETDRMLLDVCAEYHAYCSACRYHFYSRFDPCDVISCFAEHVNTEEHLVSSTWVTDEEGDEMFVCKNTSLGLWTCRACNKDLECDYKTGGDLKTDILLHTLSPTHEQCRKTMTDPRLSLLVAVSTNDIFKQLLKKTNEKTEECCLCRTTVEEFHQLSHLESAEHLGFLEYFLKSLTNVDAADYLVNEEALKNLWKDVKSGKIPKAIAILRESVKVDVQNEDKFEENAAKMDCQGPSFQAVSPKKNSLVSSAQTKPKIEKNQNSNETKVEHSVSTSQPQILANGSAPSAQTPIPVQNSTNGKAAGSHSTNSKPRVPENPGPSQNVNVGSLNINPANPGPSGSKKISPSIQNTSNTTTAQNPFPSKNSSPLPITSFSLGEINNLNNVNPNQNPGPSQNPMTIGNQQKLLKNLGEVVIFQKDSAILHVAHPSFMVRRVKVSWADSFLSDHIDVVNGVHAYCKICDHHMYSQRDCNDPCSYFRDHFNSESHKVHARGFDPNTSMLNDYYYDNYSDDKSYCMACKVKIVSNTFKNVRGGLNPIIKRHILDKNHQSLMTRK